MRRIKYKAKRSFRDILMLAAVAVIVAIINLLNAIPTHVYRWFGVATVAGVFLWLIFKLKYKPEKYINERGYVMLKRENELEHRYIAKNIIGRELKPNEVVHHINGKKTDNELRNLCLMDGQKHEQFHAWLDWKRKKDGRYPRFQDQKRILASEYGGTLLQYVRSRNFANTKDLFNQLRTERKKLARQYKVPAYLIFSDKALHEMVRLLPETEESMMAIRGVGHNNFKMYGPQFLSIIKRYKLESSKKKDSA